MQSAQGLGELIPQNILLQQPALQAAFAAQCMAAQAQSKSPQTVAPKPPQPLQISSESSLQGNQITAACSEGTLPQDDKVTSQELSVAQMMMTLARASKNTLAHNGGNSTQHHTPDGSNTK